MKPKRSFMAIILMACTLAILSIAFLGSSALSPAQAQGGATSQQQTVQAIIEQRFTQTVQQQVALTQTATAALAEPLTATAGFQNTVDAAFNAALTATAQASQSPAVLRYAGITSGTTTTGPNGAYPTAFPYLGEPNAPVKIEEISSISCPYCMTYHQQIVVNLLDEIRAGRLEFILLPTTETGAFDAVPGTKAAYCAMQQGRFWPMLDLLFEGLDKYQSNAGSALHIANYAQQSGLDAGKFHTCYNGTDAAQFVTAANHYAEKRGLLGTPSVFIYVNGQQMLPAQQPKYLTPGSMAGLSLADLRHIIESGTIPNPKLVPTDTPTSGPTLNAAAFDMRSAKLYKSAGDVIEMLVPSGWLTTVNPPSDGTSSWTFTYGGTGPQDALLSLQIQLSDEKTAYQNFDETGKANSPATALQALIDANSTPQPGSLAISFSKVQPVKVGALNGQGITVDVPASAQGPEAKYDIRLAQMPHGKAVYVLARGDVSLWDKAQPIVSKMIDSLVIKPQNIPTPTATATLHPLLITATALQKQIDALTPSVTPTVVATASPVAAAIGT